MESKTSAIVIDYTVAVAVRFVVRHDVEPSILQAVMIKHKGGWGVCVVSGPALTSKYVGKQRLRLGVGTSINMRCLFTNSI